MKSLRFRIAENVFRKHLTVLVDGDTARAARLMARLAGDAQAGEGLELIAGRTFYPALNGDTLIWLRSRTDLATMVHELAHATFRSLETAGVPVSREHDEAFAYLLQFFTNRVLEQLGHGRFCGPRRLDSNRERH